MTQQGYMHSGGQPAAPYQQQQFAGPPGAGVTPGGGGQEQHGLPPIKTRVGPPPFGGVPVQQNGGAHVNPGQSAQGPGNRFGGSAVGPQGYGGIHPGRQGQSAPQFGQSAVSAVGNTMPAQGPPPPPPTTTTGMGSTMQAPPPMGNAFRPQPAPPVGSSAQVQPPPPTGNAAQFQPPPATGNTAQPSMNSMIAPPPFSVTSPSKPAPTQQSKSIDPNQMPRPPSKILPTQVFETMKDGMHSVPPSTEVPIAVRDTGNAGPRFMRSSMNSVPQGNDLVKSSSVPFVVAVQPLALQGKGDSAIPLIDSTSDGPFRCSNCNAYACPFMKFSSNGTTMTCCFCGSQTQVPSEHVGQVGMNGRRVDGDVKPEFSFGTVEHIVSGKYQIREPMLPTYVFLIDCTLDSVATGVTGTVCSALSSLIDSVAGKERARIAIVTFDSSVQFYDLLSASEDPKMFVMGDVQDPFCPLGANAFVPLEGHSNKLKQLLARIPELYKDTKTAESAGGAAIQSCIDALRVVGGGKLLSFICSLPHKGALSLRPREAGKPPSEKDALDIMTPVGNGKQYSDIAKQAAQHQISIDVFALSKSYIDLATISLLSSGTSGSVYRYSPFSCIADSARFFDDLRWNLTRPIGFEAVGRMRVSSGLAVDETLGSFHRAGQTDLQFPAITSDSALCVKIVHEERLKEGSQAYFQFAVLYSTTSGQRRVRVHSLALPVTRSLGSVFRGADLEVYLSYLARKVSMGIPGKSLSFSKDIIHKSAIGTLLAYRKHCASSSSSGQLILPESLKLLPLFCLGLMKLPCFRTDSRADARAVWMSRLLSLPIDRLLPAVHPRFVRVPVELAGENDVPMPERLPLSAEKLSLDSIYVLENGFDLFVLVGRDVAPNTMEAVLGTSSLEAIDASSFADFPNQNNPVSDLTRRMIANMRRLRRSYMHMRFVAKGHPHETLFQTALVEDRHLLSGMSYVEYLCFLHRQIQNKMP
ncbi:Protein transport protein Sec24-like CEF [Picochlorum sp. SENEW3]|nr:Protein transport protein Sec24-like CEF [Picochlorum sp. SENEW3]